MIYIKYTENERFSNTSHTKNHRKLCPQKLQKLSSLNAILCHNLFNFVKVLWRKINSKKTLSKLPFGGKFKDKQNVWIRSWFQKDVLIGQFPSKSVKVFLRKIGWVSIPSKSIKVLWQSCWCRFTDQRTLTKFLMEDFDRVNGPLYLVMIPIAIHLYVYGLVM